MTNLPTPELQAAVERASLLAAACDVPGFDHLPIVTRANAAPFAADLRLILAALEARGKALEPFAEAARKAAISGQPPFYFVGAEDYSRALTALGGTADV